MSTSKGSKKKGKAKTRTRSRRWLRWTGLALVLGLFLYASIGTWFVHHPRAWLGAAVADWPGFVTDALFWIGNPVGDMTDAFGLTGHDVVYEYDEAPPTGATLFAGTPIRTGFPAPDDIQVIDRGDFVIGWSPSLRHPVWCAYHVTAGNLYEVGKRPGFRQDKSAPNCPKATDYTRTNYDRGHMAPNYAITSRYGLDAQAKTFLMSNVSPQTPSLNRGVWRDVEHRIAELWTARYGEIWVIVGCISQRMQGHETLSGTNIDVPTHFYQIIVAQEGYDIRVQSVLFPQTIPRRAWPTRNLVTVDEIEGLSGLDFLPDLPGFIQDPLEAELPTRLWPIRARDIFRQLAIRFREW